MGLSCKFLSSANDLLLWLLTAVMLCQASTTGVTQLPTEPSNATLALTATPEYSTVLTTATTSQLTDPTTVQASTTDLPTTTEVLPVTTTIPTVGIPTNVTVTDYTTTTITVTWEHSHDDTDYYMINATCNVDSEIECVDGSVRAERNDTSGTVENLTPGAEYAIVVTAYHINGQESSSNETIQRTKPEPPTNVGIEDYNSTAITVNWTQPDGIFTGFIILYGSENSEFYTNVSTNYNETSEELTSLTPGETYSIWLLTISGAEISETSSSVIQTTIPRPPSVIGIGYYNSTTISVNWTEPSGFFTGYTIWYDSEDTELQSSVPAASEDTEKELVGLTPGDTYTIWLQTISGNQTSEMSNTVYQTTIPEPPTDVDIDDHNTTAITVAWTPPVNNVFTNFSISYESMTTGQLSKITANMNDTRTDLSDLTPGDTYNIKVQTVSGSETSEDSNSVNQTTVPEYPTDVEVTSYTTESMTVEWTAPEGNIFTDFIVSYESSATQSSQNVTEDGKKNQTVLTNLTPGDTYTVKLQTVSGTETSSDSNEALQTTVPRMASPERQDQSVTMDTIGVKWRSPNVQGGITSQYAIGCPQGGTASPNSVPHSDTEEMKAKCTSLGVPGRAYTITVISVSNDVESDAVSEVINTVPKKASPQIREDSVTNTAIGARWLDPNEGTGEISTYEIACSGTGNPTPAVVDHINTAEMSAQCTGLSTPGQAYTISVTSVSGNSRSDNVSLSINTKPEKPTIRGSERTHYSIYLEWTLPDDNVKDYFIVSYADSQGNNKTKTTPFYNITLSDLSAEESYRVGVRARSGTATGDSVVSTIITAPAPDSNALVLGLTLGLLLPILLATAAVLGIIYYMRYYKPQHRKRFEVDGNDNPTFSAELQPKRVQSQRAIKKSSPVKLVEYDEYFRMMEADSGFRFSEEYEELRHLGQDQSTEAAELPENRSKNRFTNILPYDRTRVKLSSDSDSNDDSDYINANWMPGYNSPREFIATQGPLPETADDFWKLVWEYNIKTIVMVTRCREGARDKCSHYWPFDNEPVLYGEIAVNIMEEETLSDWTITDFYLQMDDVTKSVRHYNFTVWPDHDVPDETGSLIQFIRSVRQQMPKDNSPTLVHCSAGVGRTGTFITLDRLIQHMRDHDYVDIYGIACEMRMHRVYMIQTESQYVFIHQCVYDLLHENDEEVEEEEAEDSDSSQFDSHTYTNVPPIRSGHSEETANHDDVSHDEDEDGYEDDEAGVDEEEEEDNGENGDVLDISCPPDVPTKDDIYNDASSHTKAKADGNMNSHTIVDNTA